MSSSFAGFLLIAQQAEVGPQLTSTFGPSFPVIWTISAGVLLGMVIVALVYFVAAMISRKAGMFLEELIFDGLLKPVFYVSLLPAAIALLLLYVAPVRPVFAQFRKVLAAAATPSVWGALEGTAPEGLVLFWSATFVVALFLLGLILQLAFPKITAVAYITGKEGMAQPLFWVCLAGGAFALLVFVWIPYSTLGEDLKMLKIQGLELLTPLAILLAVSAASVSMAEDVEMRTALTVLSKPIGRRQFVLGKFLGVLQPVLVMFLVLGFIYLGTVSYKRVFEGFESGVGEATSMDCRLEVVSVVPALILRFMEAVAMAAISVLAATRLPMLANFAVCGMIYVVGHLTPMVVQSAGEKFPIVQFMGQLIATVVPVLQNYDVQAGITAGQAVPWSYLFFAGLYCLCYCAFALLGALFLFEDRDLA